MMKNTDIYGFGGRDLDSVRKLVEGSVDIEFEARESSFLGGDYFLARSSSDEKWTLRSNYSPEDDDWYEDSHRNHRILLLLEGTERSEDIERRLVRFEGIALLRREPWPV